ncbi:MAG: phosphotransferase family protein [Anaerolineae bacterium]|nr:phosphotransferase family protein [Anaerolineae bacterium]
MHDHINAIIAQIPIWQDAQVISIELQQGGLTNTNYFVTVDGERFVLRVGDDNAIFLGIDRHTEHAALLAASSIGIIPEVIAFMLPEGHLVTRFIEGREWSIEEFKQPDVIWRVATAMRRVHELPSIPGTFSPYRDVERRLALSKTREVPLPEQLQLNRFLDKMYEIETSRAATMPGDWVLCHNDPFPNNFLDDGRVRLLDWEFAGMGDRFYDLASVCHFFSPEQKAYFLECYFGKATSEAITTLEQMWFVVAFWNATWALLQIGTPHIEHDYAAMAHHIFTGMEKWLS